MRIALVNSVARNPWGYADQRSIFPPLGLQVLAYRTPREHQVTLYDESFGQTRFEAHLSHGRFDLVAVTAMTAGAPRAYEIGEMCRAQGVRTVFGGIHASACSAEASQFFDSVAVGECDTLWPSILADADAGRLAESYTGGPVDLVDEIGRADSRLRPENRRHRYSITAIQTSRGCPVGCKFCSVTRFNGPRVRRRNLDSLIEEWNAAPRRIFRFVVDDNFFGVSKKDAEWAKMFCQRLIRSGKRRPWFSQTTANMGDDAEALKLAYRAGCRMMLVGFESFDPQVVKAYGKGRLSHSIQRQRELIDGFHRAGIAVYGTFILGSDQDTVGTAGHIRQTANALGIDVFQISTLTPLPGTVLYEQMHRQGRLLATRYPQDWQRYSFAETVIRPKRMTAKQMDRSLYEVRLQRLHFPETVLRKTFRTLARTRSPRTAIIVHGFNRRLRQMGRNFLRRGRAQFGETP